MTYHCEKAKKHLIILNDFVARRYAVENGGLTMAEYKCGDCFHAELCEKSEMLVGFSKGNYAYCSMFLNSADVALVVRCRDCKHYKPQKKSTHWENRANYCNRVVTIKAQPNDFCSYGERKDGDD